MKRVGCCLFVLLLALPALRGDDKPKDDKKPPPTAQEQYQTLLKEFSGKRAEILADYRKTEGEARQKLLQKFYGVGKEFADRFYKLAEDNPKDPAAADALFWVLQNGSGTDAYDKAAEKVAAFVREAPLKQVADRLKSARVGVTSVVEAVVQRAEKNVKDPSAEQLLVWAATNGFAVPAGRKAMEVLVEKYPENPAVEQVYMMLGRGAGGEAGLKGIVENSSQPKLRAAAAIGLGQAALQKLERLEDKPAEAEKVTAEAEKYLAMATDLAKDIPSLKEQAGHVLKAVHNAPNLREGKAVPDIQAPDLDGKEFKLSEYRGKVVMLDFWGNW